MENLGMFLNSLLVLVVVIQVTDACSCEPRTVEKAMCDADTVLKAAADNAFFLDKSRNKVCEEASAAYTKYEMYLLEVYKNGSNPLSFVHGRTFEMVVPRRGIECSAVLSIDTVYFLSGQVNGKGILKVNKCELILPVPSYQLSEEEAKAIIDPLIGERPLNCGGV